MKIDTRIPQVAAYRPMAETRGKVRRVSRRESTSKTHAHRPRYVNFHRILQLINRCMVAWCIRNTHNDDKLRSKCVSLIWKSLFRLPTSDILLQLHQGRSRAWNWRIPVAPSNRGPSHRLKKVPQDALVKRKTIATMILAVDHWSVRSASRASRIQRRTASDAYLTGRSKCTLTLYD